MPLVVPALRFFVVFLNVYETFKNLKPPPPSARRGGQPSVRAMTQRKRDLKGCLAVWVVWCCYVVYERTFDRVVGIFLPFYSEMKSVFLLFLVLTRAKGAEPLFLHVLRPLVKPYSAVVDPMLELSRDIGDFLFALLQVPLDYILSSPWLSLWCTGKLEEVHDESSSCMSSPHSGDSAHTSNHPSIPILAVHSDTSRVLDKPHGLVRNVSDNRGSNGRPSAHNPADPRASRNRYSYTTSLPAYSEHPSRDPPRYSQTLPRHYGHQTWYPPTFVRPASSCEAPISTSRGTAPEYHSPEWRTYPAFPSAYPPTPLPPSVSLPSPVVTRSDGDHSAYPPIPEDEQDFEKVLEKVHEGCPGFVHRSSNNNKMPSGAIGYEENSDITRQPDEDTLLDDNMCSSEAGLSEDDFGASSRTPHPPPEAMLSSAYSSVDSLTSALTTTDNASLRTKTSSDSLNSGSSSLVGRKRAHEVSQSKVRDKRQISHSRDATLRGKPAPTPIRQDSLQSNASDEDVGGDDSSTKAKRQKVLGPSKRKSTVRPAPRGSGNARKAVSSLRIATGHNRAAPTVSRQVARARAGSATTANSTIRGRSLTLASRQAMRSEPHGVAKSSSACSSQSGTLKGKAY